MTMGREVLAQTTPRSRPNVLFILTDQQRLDTLGCAGNDDVQTPNLDSLAKRGVLFESCYVTQPVCSPCRSSMVTGLFPNATTVVENNLHLPADLFAWPRALHDAGYETAYIGKWHLGVEPVPDYFDLWRGFHTGWKHWIREEPFYAAPGEMDSEFRERMNSYPSVVPKQESLIGRYRPDVEADYALEFIEANKDRPFACWLSFYPPHTPKEAPEEDVALYRGRIEPEEQAVYHAMVHRLDWNIGRVMAQLDAFGLRENTLVVFTSDHGENHPKRWNQHLKRLCYDSSARVPLIMSCPGMLPEGKRVQHVVSTVDLCPTILEFCGMLPPSDLHGQSMKNLLSGNHVPWREDVFVQNNPYRTWERKTDSTDPDMRERCVITDDWKLILNTSRAPELYHRRGPVEDADNLYGKPDTRDISLDMAKRMLAWAKTTGDEIAPQLVSQWFPS